MNKRLYGAILMIVLVIAFSSCHIFKRGTRTKTKPAKDTAIAITVVVPPKDTVNVDNSTTEKQKLLALVTPLFYQQIQFNTFSGRAKCHFESKGDKQDFTANIRIKKDSVIWVSVAALGGIVQVARIYITPDTVKLINYLQKEVTVMPLSSVEKVLPAPADFSVLQNLLIGNVLRQSGTPTDVLDLENVFSLQVEDNSFSQLVNFNKSDSTIKDIRMRTSELTGPSGLIQYDNYQQISDQKFPMSRMVNVINAGEQYLLDMKYNKVDINEHLDFPFSIPKNYILK